MKKIFLLLLILSLLVGCSSAKNDFMRVYSKEDKKIVDGIGGFTISDTFDEITVNKNDGFTWLTYLIKDGKNIEANIGVIAYFKDKEDEEKFLKYCQENGRNTDLFMILENVKIDGRFKELETSTGKKYTAIEIERIEYEAEK